MLKGHSRGIRITLNYALRAKIKWIWFGTKFMLRVILGWQVNKFRNHCEGFQILVFEFEWKILKFISTGKKFEKEITNEMVFCFAIKLFICDRYFMLAIYRKILVDFFCKGGGGRRVKEIRDKRMEGNGYFYKWFFFFNQSCIVNKRLDFWNDFWIVMGRWCATMRGF